MELKAISKNDQFSKVQRIRFNWYLMSFGGSLSKALVQVCQEPKFESRSQSYQRINKIFMQKTTVKNGYDKKRLKLN